MPVADLGIEAIEHRVLRIQLDKPTPALPAMLAHVALLPTYQKESAQFVSNGAYRLVNQQDDFIHLEKILIIGRIKKCRLSLWIIKKLVHRNRCQI